MPKALRYPYGYIGAHDGDRVDGVWPLLKQKGYRQQVASSEGGRGNGERPKGSNQHSRNQARQSMGRIPPR